MKYRHFVSFVVLCSSQYLGGVQAWAAEPASNKASPTEKKPKKQALEEVVVWTDARTSHQAGYTNPTSVLNQSDLGAINATTTEDLVKYEPSLIIRKRYIGDSNGTLGLRGSNMFATPRSMVFADGVPLHYLLQTRWSGAPRWTMVSASEIAQIEVLYGPFSAEYSGNSMGGVILIETAIPQKKQVNIDVDYYLQDFSAYGFSDQLSGYKTFISAGDKYGDTSVYVSYNHLENNSQPQSYYFDLDKDQKDTKVQQAFNGATAATGLITDRDVVGNTAYYFGDTGVEQATTDNFKAKIGYDFGAWSSLFNIAFEDRNTLRDAANSYVKNAQGQTLWSGNIIENNHWISINAGRLTASELNRESLSLGARLKGDFSQNTKFEGNINQFRILKDNSRTSSHALQDPLFKGAGRTTDYDDTGWQTLEGKWTFKALGVEGLELIAGGRHEAYQLNLDEYNSSQWLEGDNAGYTGRSGGETDISALFVQSNWDINAQWMLALGGRYEQWHSQRGYYSKDIPATPEFDLVLLPKATKNQFSPKFSLGYIPADTWLVRYSLAKAYRFPIVEELFTQSQNYTNRVEAQPDLKPENGLHHNLMLEKQLSDGYARINLFTETIQDAIESQSNYLPGGFTIITFSAVDEVQTDGIELILNQYGFLLNELDVRFNVAYTKSIIVDNSTAEGVHASSSSFEGNDYPRMPRWRGNLLATYHLNDAWDLNASVQYAQKSFGRLDNTDTAERVMGAQDGYTRFGLKTNYQLTESFKVDFGIDNLTNQHSYVAHPWPGRSYYVSLAYDY